MRREARLKPEYAARYPEVPCNVWEPTEQVMDRLLAGLLLHGAGFGEIRAACALDAQHFDLRGTDGVGAMPRLG
jgi:hypothetical protein